MRAGYTVFAISPRNSPEAVAHLLSKTEAALLLVSSEPSMVALGEAGLKIFQSSSMAPPMDHMPTFEYLLSSISDDTYVNYPSVHYNLDSPALILHSSGAHIRHR